MTDRECVLGELLLAAFCLWFCPPLAILPLACAIGNCIAIRMGA
jgi:hypothetical protein